VVIQEHFKKMAICHLEKESFSLITSFHNLEHLQDPYHFLREANRVLISEGSIILEVPNLNSWQSKIGQNAWILLDVENHHFHFTVEGLAGLMQRSGFEVRRFSTFSIQYGILGMVDAITFRIRRRCGLFKAKNKSPQYALNLTNRNLRYWLIFSLAFLPSVLIEIVASIRKKGGVLRVECTVNLNRKVGF
jgi:SAM-dependent methyltransferase